MYKMSLPMTITEDTPPDMLSGSMDVCVLLPNKTSVRLNVERSTPMLDLLVQITTANKLSPGSHYIQAYEEDGTALPYKPSTPIGTLDTVSIHVVQKSSKPFCIASKKAVKQFEKTYRIQIHLPHNQLYVLRTIGNTKLSDILSQVCETKNLDISKYSFRHPVQSDKILCLTDTVADLNLHQLALVSNCDRSVGVSAVDIIGIKGSLENCEGSLSSGSLGGRSLSPARSDASTESPPLAPVMPPSRQCRKRRPAPKPPQLQSRTSVRSAVSDSNYIISHSRNSSDSSGYHEASLLSESPESNSLPDSLPRRSKLSHHSSTTNIPEKFKMSQSCSNLNSAGTGGLSLYKKSNFSSSVSLSTAGARKKKPAPLPPPLQSKMSALPEEKVQTLKSSKVSSFDIEEEIQRKSSTLPYTYSSPPSSDVDPSSPSHPKPESCSSRPSKLPLSKVPLPTPRTKLSFPETEGIPKTKRRAPEPPKKCKKEDNASTKDSLPNLNASETSNNELKMDDEEIDRIFHNATKDYETPSLTYTECNEEPESLQWEYKLPPPPSAFRDLTNQSPTLTEFDTVTIGNLTEIIENKSPQENLVNKNEKNANYLSTLNEESDAPVRFPNEIIVSVTIENDYKKYDRDDHESKQNSMGNDSGLELDDAASKTYESDNHNFVNSEQDKASSIGEEEEEDEHTKMETNNNKMKAIYVDENNDRNMESILKETNNNVLNGLKSTFNLDDTKEKAVQNSLISSEYKQYEENIDNNLNSRIQTQETKKTSIQMVTKPNDVPDSRKITNEIKGDSKIPKKDSSRNENCVTSHENLTNKTNNLQQARKDVINKEPRDKKASKVTETKSAVMNELSSFINESKTGVRDLSSLMNEKNTRVSGNSKTSANPTSSLINFQISAYEKMKKPISIYCDDSVVVATKPKQEKPNNVNAKVNRHNSLSQYDRPDMSSAMKRSSSYISLLSNPVKFNLQRFDKFFSSSCENLKAAPSLRRTSSELNFNNENNSIIKMKETRREVPWKRSAQNMSELQSLQVLKSILPHLSVPEENSLDREKENYDQVLPKKPEYIVNTVSEKVMKEDIRREETIAKDKEMRKKRYSYPEAPYVNFTTWDQRPNPQNNTTADKNIASIKKNFENPHKFSNVNYNNNNIVNVNAKHLDKENELDNVDPRNISSRLLSRMPSYKRTTSTEITSPHAPIVKSVELKKPFPYNKHAMSPNVVVRPMTYYLFGDNTDFYNGNNNKHSDGSDRDVLLESIRSFGKDSLKKTNR